MTRREERESRRAKYSDAYKRADEKTSGDRSSIKIPDGMKLFGMKKEGVYRLDILPYVAGEGNKWAEPGSLWYERTFFTHRAVGPDNEIVVCPAGTWKKKCPVCEFSTRLRNNPNYDKELAKSLFPKQRQLFLVIDRSNRDDGVQLWDISFHLFGKLLDFRISKSNRELNYGQFFYSDEENPGMYLEVGAEEKSFAGQKFYEAKTIDFIPRKHAIKQSILDKLPCLDELPKAMKYDALKELFMQSAPTDGDPTDDDDDPPRTSRRRDDDDDDDEEPNLSRKALSVPGETDEDEDDERPRGRHRDDDDEEDDQDEDDD